jgi:DNA-binding beta-propeller fold protein YncE
MAAFVLVGSNAYGQTAILTHQGTISGARVTSQPNPAPLATRRDNLPAYLHWLSPVAVAARNTFLYVADAGRRHIFRYDSLRQTISPFADYPGGAAAAIAVAPDLSLYVADTNGRQIMHFSQDGRLLRSFSNAVDLGRPVAVVLNTASNELLVGDSLYNHVLVFNSLGQTVAAYKSEETRGIDAMARGPDGIYLVDRQGRQVAVLAPDGRDIYTVGAGTLVDPNAIAVDSYNRIFVSDVFDNTIKVYERGQMIEKIGGAGAPIAFFNRVTGLSLDHDMLYVADSMNNRVQVFRLTPPRRKDGVHE